MSHPAQSKYGACKAINKHGVPCGLAIVRLGCCQYHQPEEVLARAKKKLERNEKERAVIVQKMQAAYDKLP
jgi:hypothetical protein